jgi:hypothetical protein
MEEAETPSLFERCKVAAEQLQTDGFAVIEGVFSEDECTRNKAELLSWISKTTQKRVDPTDSSTFTSQNWVPHTHFILQHYGIGHCRAAWNARTQKNAIAVFAHLYGTDKLTTSFDGANYWPAPELMMKNGSRWPADKTWLHVDQTPYHSGLECIQSWATFEEVDGEWDATLMVVPGSHKIHKDLAAVHKCAPVTGSGRPDRNDWYKFSPDELERVLGKDWKTTKTKRISAPKGSMVLWDSRTFHQGCAPRRGRPTARDRAIVYLCYAPTRWMTETQKEKKRKAAREHRTTTHWPLKSKLFPATARTYGRVLPDFDLQHGDGRDDKDPSVRKLCCFDEYETAGGLLGWTRAKSPLLPIALRK